jgi:hypothetical protein
MSADFKKPGDMAAKAAAFRRVILLFCPEWRAFSETLLALDGSSASTVG